MKTYRENPPGAIKSEVLFVAPEILGDEQALKKMREMNEARRAAASARPDDFFKFAEYYPKVDKNMSELKGQARKAMHRGDRTDHGLHSPCDDTTASDAGLATIIEACSDATGAVDYHRFLVILREKHFPCFHKQSCQVPQIGKKWPVPYRRKTSVDG